MDPAFVQEDSFEDAVATATTIPASDIIAQSVCSSMVGGVGWMYAVRRTCLRTNKKSCVDICESSDLHSQDPQIKNFPMRAVGALHVYLNRPPSTVGDPPNLGQKVLRFGGITTVGCGPNFCCCHVPG